MVIPVRSGQLKRRANDHANLTTCGVAVAGAHEADHDRHISERDDAAAARNERAHPAEAGARLGLQSDGRYLGG